MNSKLKKIIAAVEPKRSARSVFTTFRCVR